MSGSTPPTKMIESARLGNPWRVALVSSLALHLGLGAFTILNPHPLPGRAGAILPANASSDRPYTPSTYARKVASAEQNVRTLVQAANQMEQRKRQVEAAYEKRTGRTPPGTDPATAARKAEAAAQEVERAVGEAAQAQQEAQDAQREAGAAQREANQALANGDMTGYRQAAARAAKAAHQARTAQAKAFAAQDRTQQAARHRAAVNPALARRAAATAERPNLEEALRKQLAADQAQRTAQRKLDQAALARTLVEAKRAQAEAARAQEQAAQLQKQATAEHRVVREQVKVRRYDRESAPAPPRPQHGGPPERVIIAYTDAEEKAGQASAAQQQAGQALERARDAQQRAAAAARQGDAKAREAALKAARQALWAAAQQQKQTSVAQNDTRRTLAKEGPTIPGRRKTQRQVVQSAIAKQRRAAAARRKVEDALRQGDLVAAQSALEAAEKEQTQATVAQEKVLNKLHGAFGPKPPTPPGLDPQHVHTPACFQPGGT